MTLATTVLGALLSCALIGNAVAQATKAPARPPSARLDSYVDRYAARTAGMTASEIRALFAVASRPEVVSLAGGMPNISGLPLDVVGGAIADLVATQGPVAMQYGSGQGVPELREQITDVMRLEGIEAHPDDVVVRAGRLNVQAEDPRVRAVGAHDGRVDHPGHGDVDGVLRRAGHLLQEVAPSHRGAGGAVLAHGASTRPRRATCSTASTMGR